MKTQSVNKPKIQPMYLFEFSQDEKAYEKQQIRIEAWIEALKSGKFTRNTSNRLRDKDGYSPLGVASATFDIVTWHDRTDLPTHERLALSNSEGGCRELFNDGVFDSLAALPTDLSFERIAEIIADRYWAQKRYTDLWLQLCRNEDLGLFRHSLLKDEKVRANIESWIVALRTDSYKQGKDTLCSVLDDNTCTYGYCCLGVANDWLELGEKDIHHLDSTYSQVGLKTPQGEFRMPDDTIELETLAGVDTWYRTRQLAIVNDCWKLTFLQIATFLQTQLYTVTSSFLED